MAAKRESLGRRSARTFSALTVGRTLSLLIGILSIILIARLLGPAGYGIFTIAFAFFSLVSAASNFGFGQYLIKHLAEAEDKRDRQGFSKALGAGMASVVLIGLALTLLGIGISAPVASLLNIQGVTSTILIIAASIVFFAMMYGSTDYALVGAGRNMAAAALEILENVVLLVASVWLVLLGYGPDGAVAGILVSYMVAGAIGTYLIFRFAHKSMRVGVNVPTSHDMREAAGFALPIGGNNFMNNSMPSLATLLLGFFISAQALGNFGIAMRARTILSTYYVTAAVTLIPTLTIATAREAKRKGESRLEYVYNKTMLYSLLATIPIIAYLGIYSTPLIYLLISQNFGSAPLYLSLIALGTAIGLAGVYASSMFIARAKTSKLLIYTGICTVVQLVSLAIFLPLWGVLGAIFSLFFVEGVVCDYLFLRGARTVLGLKTDYGRLVRAFASNGAVAIVLAAGLLMSGLALQLVYGVIAIMIAYPFFLVLFGTMDGEDVETLRESTRKLRALRITLGPMLTYFDFLVGALRK
ncbi:MAG: polysaccharide biosynthesis protein [Candidatus Micrarchaeota archaeon]|nr:polysaccharide biosynthesis protein [Candidatus Micrarchaeota archaeon]